MKRKPDFFLRLALTITALAVVFELVSLLLIKSMNVPESPFFNRNYSPFCLFENTPGYIYHHCTGNNNCDNDVTIDSNGFITNNVIKPEKAENTYRIFLVGGSAAFGNGQSVPYNTIKPYPQGIYTFEASIAGLLEKKLQAQFPEINIEVINACASGRTLSQSIGLYKARLRKFKPDMVVSLDGMNETGFFGKTFNDIVQLRLNKYYKDLQQKSNCFNKKTAFSTLKLIKYIKLKKMQHEADEVLKLKAPGLLNYHYDNYKHEDYLKIETNCIKNSKGFIDNVLDFNDLCRADSVRFVFGLQPMLYRLKYNKALCPDEENMRLKVNPVNLTLTADVPASLHDTIFNMGNLVYKYFFDDYLSQKIEELAVGKFIYVDFNKEIANVNDSVEFYTDYCHLTATGNEIVAEILLRKMGLILNSKNDQKSILINLNR